MALRVNFCTMKTLERFENWSRTGERLRAAQGVWMMQWLNRVWMGVAALALVAGMTGPACAAPKDGTGPAVVNFQRLYEAYQKTSAYAKYGAKMRDAARQFQEEMQLLAQLRYCTDAERAEALALKAKSKLSPAEQARLDSFLKKADAIDNEASRLAQKQNPTEADTKRLADISKMRTEAARSLAKQDADRRDKMRALEQEAFESIETELINIVEKVAKDQKVDVVYDRRSVLVGGVDLTEAAIKKLPK